MPEPAHKQAQYLRVGDVIQWRDGTATVVHVDRINNTVLLLIEFQDERGTRQTADLEYRPTEPVYLPEGGS